MRSSRNERGLALWSLLLVLFLVIFFGTLIIKLSGSYYDQFTLDSMLSRTSQEVSGRQQTEADIRDRLRKNLNINNIDLDMNKALDFDMRSNSPKMILDYEKRIHIFGNVDVVLSFYEEYGL